MSNPTYLGSVHIAERRRASASQQLYQLFKTDDLYFEAIIPALEECDALGEALSLQSVDKLANLLGIEKAAYIDSQFEESAEGGESSETGQEEVDEAYSDPLIEIIKADKSGVLYQHPWVVNRLRTRFGKRWRRLAVALTVPWASYMQQPLELLPDNTVIIPDLAPGQYICFKNPIRNPKDIRILTNVVDRAAEFNMESALEKNGVIFSNTYTASTLSNSDYDGDNISVLFSYRNKKIRLPKNPPPEMPPGITDWAATVNITSEKVYIKRPSC